MSHDNVSQMYAVIRPRHQGSQARKCGVCDRPIKADHWSTMVKDLIVGSTFLAHSRCVASLDRNARSPQLESQVASAAWDRLTQTAPTAKGGVK